MRNFVLGFVAIGFPGRSHQPIVECEPDVCAQRLCPCREALFLARDERVERIEHKRPHSGQLAFRFSLAHQIIKQRDKKAFGLSRTGPARNQHGLRVSATQQFPASQLMRIGRVIEPQIRIGRSRDRVDRAGMQQCVHLIGALPRGNVAGCCLKELFRQKSTFCRIRTGKTPPKKCIETLMPDAGA